jgi:methionyl-tRNA synthetase
MEGYALHMAASAVFRLVDATNEFIAETAPWSLARSAESAERLDQVLGDVAEAVRIVGVLLLPIMPRSAAEILRRMGETRVPADLRFPADAQWSAGRERAVMKADPMWPRLEENDSKKETQPMTSDPAGQPPAPAIPVESQQPQAPTPAAPVAEPAPAADGRISIDEFMRIELRVAKILAAERVPKSKKLVKMQIDVGTEERTIVAGIAEAYAPEVLVGRTIVVVANLKPAKLMGIESNGMVLAASPDGGLPVLLGLDQTLPPGTRVR